MSIDIDFEKLSTKELMELNHRIVSVIKQRNETRRKDELGKFKAGEFASFENDDGDTLHGLIVRVNQKTITIDTEKYGIWRISPSLAKKSNKRLELLKH